MNQPVQERHGHLLIAKDLRPLCKGQIGGNANASAFVAITEEVEEELGGGLGEGEVAELIDLCGCPHRSTYADPATMPRVYVARV